MMKAKEYLQRLKKLDTIINQKIKEIDNLKDMCTSVSSFDYSMDKVQTSFNKDSSYVKIMDRICDLQDELNMDIDKFIDERHKIINQIQGLSKSKHIEMLFKRYVEYKNIDIIATEMRVSYTYAVELHGFALQEFRKTYNFL